MALTTTYANAIANYLRGAGAPVAITAIYLDLYNGDPSNGGTSVLATITGSATRDDITGSMAAASGGAAANDTEVTVTDGASAAALITYIALYDAATAGNLIQANELVEPVGVNLNDTVTFATGNIVIRVT